MRQFLFTLITLISFISNGYADDDKRYLQHQFYGHYKTAEEKYALVKEKCHKIHNLRKRIKAAYCLKLATLLTEGSIKHLRMKKIIELFIEEEIDKVGEWQEIYDHLYWADHHYEMMDMYLQLLKSNAS